MKYSTDLLQTFFSSPLPPPNELADLLMQHAFEVEGIEGRGKEAVLDVDILPNRGDCMSHLGLAREIAAITDRQLCLPPAKTGGGKRGGAKPVHVEIQDPDLVPRYAAVLLKGVKNKPAPAWMRKHLERLGINSISAVVDVTNYVMEELGQPLHAFDAAAIQGRSMTVRRSAKGERVETLEGAEWDLPAGILVIESGGRLIDLAGIKGGKESGVTEHTNEVFLQAAVFDRESVYRARRLLGYSTPAADRYAHGVDPEGARIALERAVSLLESITGARAVQRIDQYPTPSPGISISLPAEQTERLLGSSVSFREAAEILRRIGCSVSRKDGSMHVRVPSWRSDLRIPRDLIEEIGRVRGYSRIASVPPASPLSAGSANSQMAWEDALRDLLRAGGYAEQYRYSFIGEGDLDLLSHSIEERGDLIEIEKPLSEEYKYLRPTLADGLLKSAAANLRRDPDTDIRFFEIGSVFSKTIDGISERSVLTALVIPQKGQGEAFFAAKGMANALLERMGLVHPSYRDISRESLHERLSLLRVRGTAEISGDPFGSVGVAGSISPSILARMKISRDAAMFTLDLDRLVAKARNPHEYHPPSRFPAAFRDIAVLVPRTEKAQTLEEAIRTAAGPLLQIAELFDVYEEGEDEGDRKSLAFHLTYQSDERTLTAEEVDGIHGRVAQTLDANPVWTVRS